MAKCEHCGKRCPCLAVADAKARFRARPDDVQRAIYHAVSCWYFYGPRKDGQSKIWTALFRVVNEFDVVLAEMMIDDISSAFRVVDPEDEKED